MFHVAVLGLMGFLAEAKAPGAVPGLESLAKSGFLKAYDGEIMAPFAPGFTFLS